MFFSLYLSPRFFIILATIIALFLLSFSQIWLFPVAKIILISFFTIVLIDIFLLYSTPKAIRAERKTNEKLSNGDINEVHITLTNFYPFNISVGLIDEIPAQFQIRNFWYHQPLTPQETYTLIYELRPVERGTYLFGAMNVYAASGLGLVRRKFIFDKNQTIPVYPSYLQMQKYELLAISNRLSEVGIKKIRKIGHNREFEQIKEYVQGDDMRTINWRATARRNQLMVNHYQDEKSQQVFSLIDKGRTMKMPFEGMTLLDYAINASLVISNIAMLKSDRAGLMSFSDKIDAFLPAHRGKGAMHQILEVLYNERTQFQDTDFENIYLAVKKHINRRSLLLLYTNFETFSGMERQLKHLKALAKQHVLVVVFFENTELQVFLNTPAQNVEEIYQKTIAEKFSLEKKLIVKELQQHGVYALLTKPQNLTVDTINKYLELKARGVI